MSCPKCHQGFHSSNKEACPSCHETPLPLDFPPTAMKVRTFIQAFLVVLLLTGGLSALCISITITTRQPKKTVVITKETPPRKEVASSPLPQHTLRHEEEEEKPIKTETSPIASFPTNDFASACQWVRAHPDLVKQLSGVTIDWTVTVAEKNAWGARFVEQNDIGVATLNHGFYARVNSHTTTFRDGVASLHDGDRVHLKGEISEVVRGLGMSTHTFFAIRDYTLAPASQ